MPPVTMVNLPEISPDKEEAFVTNWKKFREVLGKKPGFLSGRLLRSLNPKAQNRFVAITQWRSDQDIMALVQDTEVMTAVHGFSFSHPALYETIAE